MLLRRFWVWLDALGNSSRRLTRTLGGYAGRSKRKRPHECANQIERLDRRIVPTQLVNVPGHHDMVYNDVDQILYITTAQGKIERYDTDTQTLLAPWTIGGNLYGADITSDGQWMYVGDRVQHSTTEGVLHKVNLTTGVVTDLIYPNNAGEGGSYDVAIMPNGIALFSSVTDGPSGFVTMRQVDLATDAITARLDFGPITELTQFDLNPDRSTAYVKSSGPYGGLVQIYSTATNSVTSQFNAGTNPQYAMGSFSRDGSQYVFEFGGYPAIINASGDTQHLFQNLTAGVAFDPHQDILYIGDDFGDELRAYDTHTWDLLYTMAAGENIINSVPLEQGEIRFGNGRIFMATPQGVRVFTPPAPTANGVHLRIEGLVSHTSYNFNTPITVSAHDASGNILTNYTGTVHFSTNHGLTVLPGDYTFTTADAGVHTFPIVYPAIGFHELTVSDTVIPNLSTRVGGIAAQSFVLGPNVLPIYATQELIYDSSRQILYMPTQFGAIERYDVANDTMLPAWSVGGRPFGGDISLDGRYLYVANEIRTAHEGFIHKFDLDTGDYIDIPFDINSYEGGAFDLSIAANGLALLTTSFQGSGSVYFRQLDTATDTISIRENAQGNLLEIEQSTYVTHGADRSVLFLTGRFGSGFSVYYSDTDATGPGVGIGRFMDSAPHAVNRDGSLIAVSHLSPLTVYDRNLQPVIVLTGEGTDGAVAFDPLRNIMYVVNSALDELRAYDTDTWAMLYSQPFGENINVYGQLTVSADGAHAFFTRGELVRVFDLQAPPALQIANVSVDEGNAGQNTATLTVTLSASSLQTVTVNFATNNGTASAGTDYVSATGTLTFQPGETSKTVSISIQGDLAFEPDETFEVILSNAVNAVIARAAATAVIRNDDFSPPTISDIGNLSTNEDVATPNLAFTIGDIDSPLTSLVVTATTSNPALVPQSSIVIAGTGANRTVRVTPAPNQFGTAIITVIVSDGALTTSDTFELTVDPVPDAPTISHIANLSTNEDTPTPPLAFTIGDIDSPFAGLIVTAASSDQSIVPNANLVIGGSGAARTLTVTPAANQSGPVTITLTVSDGTLTSQDTFTLTVVPIADPPTISLLGDQVLAEDSSTSNLAFTIGDSDSAIAGLTVTTASSNTALVPLSGIALGGSGASRTVQVVPATNQTGTATITVTVSDGLLSSSETFLVTVTPVDDAPTISQIADRNTNEDTPTPPLTFSLGDIDTAFAGLTVQASSSDTSLVPNANLVLAGSGASRTLTVTPASNQSGTVTITVSVSDGTSTVQDSFELSVLPVNDAPTLSLLTGQTIGEDSSSSQPFTIDDVDSIVGNLIVTATSSNPGLVPNANVLISGVGENRTITVTPLANASGSATITISVSDGNGTTSGSFQLTVVPGNDAPTISAFLDQTIDEDRSTTTLDFVVGDLETLPGNLVVTATSSNPALIQGSNVVFGGTGPNRTLTATPRPNQFGTAVITVTVSDGVVTTQATFTLNVNPVNDAPSITPPAAQTIGEDLSTSALAFTISDLESAAASLTVTALSSNPTLIPHENVMLAGTGANRTVRVTPLANLFGTATISLTVSDGIATKLATFNVTVSPINDVPTISNVADQSTDEDTAILALPFTLFDVETPANDLTVVATSSNPFVVLASMISVTGSGSNRAVTIVPQANASGTATLSLIVSDGTSTATETFTVTVNAVNDAPLIGTVSDVVVPEDTVSVSMPLSVSDVDTPVDLLIVTATSSNTSLLPDNQILIDGTGADRSMVMSPLANQFGSTTITISVSDGNQVTSTTFVLTVTAINDTPTISDIASQTINEDAGTSALAFTIGDLETLPENLVITVTSSVSTLIDSAHATIGGSGTNRTVTLIPQSDQVGQVSITVTVSDESKSASTSFTIVVNAVNDAPTFIAGANQVVAEDAGPVVVSTWASGISSGPGGESSQSVNFLVSTDHPELFASQPVITPNGELTYTGAPNANGVATVTITLHDNGGTTNGGVDSSVPKTFTISITPVDDALKLSPEIQQQSYALGGQAVGIDPRLSVSDPDSPIINLANSEITVSGGQKKDLISLPVGKPSKAVGEVFRTSKNVYYQGQSVATITGGKSGIPLRISFGASAGEAAINAVLKALNFKTKGKQTGPSSRMLHIAVKNTTTAIHAETTRTINVRS